MSAAMAPVPSRSPSAAPSFQIMPAEGAMISAERNKSIRRCSAARRDLVSAASALRAAMVLFKEESSISIWSARWAE